MSYKNTDIIDNIQLAILKELFKNPPINSNARNIYLQNQLNKSSIDDLIKRFYIDDELQLTEKGKTIVSSNQPKSAIILAAGFGIRMVPINAETPKGLIEVFGEPLIERLIKQLREVNIKDITIVVGFMKEQYEYLIDLYDVKLIVNGEYKTKNNLHSLNKAKDKIDCTYIIPCDIWCRHNPFDTCETHSWYLVTNEMTSNSNIHIDSNNNIIVNSHGQGNRLIGISYINHYDSKILKENIESFCQDARYNNSFWEEALIKDNKFSIWPKVKDKSDVFEINTYEQLRELDQDSNHLKNDAIDIICHSLSIKANDVKEITTLKKGMTNRSFLFSSHNERYIMRIPGEGTEQLINRQEECQVYQQIKDKSICDDVIYLNEVNGYKITKYFDNARVCNPNNTHDLKRCMQFLRSFHNLNIYVNHEFNLFGKIEYYQSLWLTNKSLYRDYETTKKNVYKLKKFVESNCKHKTLTHIDAVADNFLFINNDKEIRLIDWEYAAMQDPHVDIAMFCIYALFDRTQIDNIIDIYFEDKCDIKTRIKIYAYISICGLLWSNWCEYKSQLGIEFGEYSLRQYRYAKDYYQIVKNELNKIGESIE